MKERAIDQQVLQYLHALAEPEQRRVLKYLKSLVAKPPVQNEGLLQLAGSIPEDDLTCIEQTIAQDCEQIDHDEW